MGKAMRRIGISFTWRDFIYYDPGRDTKKEREEFLVGAFMGLVEANCYGMVNGERHEDEARCARWLRGMASEYTVEEGETMTSRVI